MRGAGPYKTEDVEARCTNLHEADIVIICGNSDLKSPSKEEVMTRISSSKSTYSRSQLLQYLAENITYSNFQEREFPLTSQASSLNGAEKCYISNTAGRKEGGGEI